VILLTVGTQLPFDRLVRLVDDLAGDLPGPFYAQIGKGKYEPRNMGWQRVIAPQQFEKLVSSASLIVAHAGIGTLVTAERHGKSLILFPRSASLAEHRNDHQMATIRALAGREGVGFATSAEELRALIMSPPQPSTPRTKSGNNAKLCATISAFLATIAKEV
jgi:UDP-N-acetylglucosamine transferase subunit ALG13